MLSRKELIDLLRAWENISKDEGVDFLARGVALDMEKEIKSILGHSGGLKCHSCGHVMENADQIEFFEEAGECGTCEHVRGEIYSDWIAMGRPESEEE